MNEYVGKCLHTPYIPNACKIQKKYRVYVCVCVYFWKLRGGHRHARSFVLLGWFMCVCVANERRKYGYYDYSMELPDVSTISLTLATV